MLNRRTLLQQISSAALAGLAPLAGVPAPAGAQEPKPDAASARTKSAGRPAEAPPSKFAITRPTLFYTPEADAILAQLQVFPADNAWNADVSRWPVHPNSARIIASIGSDKVLRYNPDMSFILVPTDQPRVPVRIRDYPGESDKGPFPVPRNLPIEGWPAYYRRDGDGARRKLTLEDVQRDTAGIGGDRHAIVVDPNRGRLYEFYTMKLEGRGWSAAQASTFDLNSNRLRPDGWTSADAAGLPIFPAVVRYDELARGVIKHALRVTITKTRQAYVNPARHFASNDPNPNLPRMGERIRLKADFDLSGFTPEVRIILQALKTYGMLVADNGIDWSLSVTPDERIPVLHEELRKVRGAAFEVVQRPRSR